MDQDEQIVAAGYDAVYAATMQSPTLRRLWLQHASGPRFPEEFHNISFVTLEQLRRMAAALRLAPGQTLVDVACGMGGPALWLAKETGARLTGVDLSAAGIALAAERAGQPGMGDRARFTRGSFADTGLEAASADGFSSEDALQYAPDKRAALREAARILRPGGQLVVMAYELDPERVAGLPVLGTDPVGDYRPLLEEAGFDVETYEEAAGWPEPMCTTYQALLDARATLTVEMGEAGANALLGEVALTLQLRPYRRRVLICATRRAAA